MLVKELDLRRRVNVLYPNPQSIFDGLHVGFVNVGTGNLAFRRRDLVLRGGSPVAFARVHDSRIEANPDFGPGWRLSLAEELLVDDAGTTYVDGSGARHRFKATADGFIADPPTPRHAGTRMSASGGKAVLREASGAVRTFEQAGVDGSTTRFRLARIEAEGRELAFSYASGLLAAIKEGSRTLLRIERGGDGRIVAATDAGGRSVRYSYSRAGLLNRVRDVAGNVWRHEYDADGRLTAALGANRKPYLQASYDSAGRVSKSRTGREYAFAYQGDRTTATEGTGERHVFKQNASGATVLYRSDRGIDWRLEFDAQGLVRKFKLSARTFEYGYEKDGAVTSLAVTSAAGTDEREYAYDADGRLTSATSSADGSRLDVAYASGSVLLSGSGADFALDLSSSGAVTSAQSGGRKPIGAEYDRDGDLVALRRGGRSVHFNRDAGGRIIDTTYPDGTANRYFYDDLGNRRMVEYGYGGSVRYGHDEAGNISEVEVTERDGTVRRQQVVVGDMNRVEKIVYVGAGTLAVEYDAMGQPVAFDTGSDVVSVAYTALGGIASISSKSTGDVWRPADDAQTAGDPDPRLAVLPRDNIVASQPDYGVLDFAEVTFEPLLRDVVGTGVPGLAAARDLLAVAGPLFGADKHAGMTAFEKPSNPVFQPDEYRSTNCCVGCVHGGLCDVCGGQNMPGMCYCGEEPPGFGGGGGGGGGGGATDTYTPPEDIEIDDVPVRKRAQSRNDGEGRTILGVVDWGDGADFKCNTIAENGNTKYRLEGTAKIGSTKITAYKKIQFGKCSEENRLSENIEITVAHERKHAQAIIDVLNSFNDEPDIGRGFSDEDACNDAGDAWLMAFEDTIKKEKIRQAKHCDHVGEDRFDTKCNLFNETIEYVVGKYPQPPLGTCDL